MEAGLRRRKMPEKRQCVPVAGGKFVCGYWDFSGHGKVKNILSLYQLIDAINFICRIYHGDLKVNTSEKKIILKEAISHLHFTLNK